MNSPQEITSTQNSRIKRAVKLRERRGRRQQGRTIVDGLRETRRALESDWTVAELFCRRTDFASPDVQGLASRASDDGVEVLVVDDAVFAKLAFGDRVEAVAATLDCPSLELSALTLPSNSLVCVLDHVEKPGNIGAVLRTLDGVGADALILSDPATDVFNPNSIRASLGAVFRVPVAAAKSEEVLAWLTAHELQILAARVEGATRYDQADLSRPTALVLGSEAEGLGERWTAPQVQAIAIPMRGEVDSLNVSASAAVLCYEALRQRITK